MQGLSNFARATALSCIMLAAAACSSTGFKADPARVGEIRTVAVVSFAVPKYIEEEGHKGGGASLAGLARTIGKQSTGGADNGAVVARDVADGFIRAMAGTGRWTFKPLDEVIRNPEINRIASGYDENRNDRMAGLPGLPIIRLRIDSRPSEFARRAAEALDVDGVMIVDASDMMYSRHATLGGSGSAKGRGTGVFVLYDRNGQPVWESRMVVHETKAKATIVAGVVVRSSTPKLHRSMGEAFAADLLQRYTKHARR